MGYHFRHGSLNLSIAVITVKRFVSPSFFFFFAALSRALKVFKLEAKVFIAAQRELTMDFMAQIMQPTQSVDPLPSISVGLHVYIT